MGKYRKLFAALIGVAVLIGLRYFEVTVPGLEPIILELIVGGLTSIGVFQATNDPA